MRSTAAKFYSSIDRSTAAKYFFVQIHPSQPMHNRTSARHAINAGPHLWGMKEANPDLGTRIAAELVFLHYMLQGADEFYRLHQEALLNREENRDQLKPVAWIPISNQ